ncbi:YhgE/Pip domain-containing protein [Microlunatus parietis]|uniref:Putative membrane protein n=1 Tax=Microlunatus parietis TaxID=682979 RepID=A0A7Y9I7X4_9ACTN|nr:YhgE/Pip domain-containing protein [Microlunatus parietis]NYE71958.1 putative membrane protein [Microlunatus parietis]
MPFPITGLARLELRRFRGPLPKIALIFVLIVPLLYGAIYLTANWDPYGRLDHLPVALVNNDRPVTYNKEKVAAGKDFIDSMHEKATFDFRDVDQAEAERGLREGDYYLAVVVPPDFSANLISGAGDDPRRAVIMLRRNDANGFVIGSITNSAQNTIARAVDESAVASYFDAVFANLATIRSGMVQASDGSGKLADGAKSAGTGAGKLERGSADAESGAAKLNAGAGQLATGLKSAQRGSADLDRGLDQLESGSADLADGAGQVADGTQQLNDRLLPVLDGVQKVLTQVQRDAQAATEPLDDLAAGLAGNEKSISDDLDQAGVALDQLRADHPELAEDKNFLALTARLEQAGARTERLAGRATDSAERIAAINRRVAEDTTASERLTSARSDLIKLNDGAHQVEDGALELNRGLVKANSGAHTLAGGIADAATGADRLATGTGDLTKGLGTLHQGLTDLTGGLSDLQGGAGKLHDQLKKGADRIPVYSPGEQDEAIQVLSSPADVTMRVDNPATYYGRGLAPMFFAIALWVFGISVFLVVRPITARALAGRGSPLRHALAGWLPIGAIAVVGGWLMVGVVWLALGLDPVQPWPFLGLVTLAAICFSAIAHLLRTALGTPGSSLLLVWLILQLTSAGGTYPSPVLPGFFAAIAPYMPMTYLIDAFRITISGGEASHLIRDVIVLAAVAVLALGLCALTVLRRQRFSMRDLHPPLVSP